jgi:hypothetical protein
LLPSFQCVYHTSIGSALLPPSIIQFDIWTSTTSLSNSMHVEEKGSRLWGNHRWKGDNSISRR